MRYLMLVTLLGLLAQSCSRPHFKAVEKNTLPNFVLPDQTGELHRLKGQETDAVILIWHSNKCRAFSKALPLISDIQQKLRSARLAFYFVNSEPDESLSDLEKRHHQDQLPFPILKDATQTFAHDLSVKEVLQTKIINSETWELIHRGPIKDIISSLRPIADCPLDYGAIEKRETITYVKDVAPILKSRCLNCHQTEGIGPWAMSEYEKVKGWSKMIGEVVATKRMPPWEIDPRSHAVKDDLTLTTAEARTLLQWVRTGSKRGEGSDPLLGFIPKHRLLPPPDLVIPVPQQVVPASGHIPYRFITLPQMINSDRWIMGAVFRPGNKKVVHHARVFYGAGPFQQMAREVLMPRRQDQEIDHNKQDFYLATFSPGSSEYLYPEGSAKHISPTQDIIVEIHYTTTGKIETDDSTLE